MKKTYMNPEITVVNVELQRICAASETIGIGGEYDGEAGVLSRDNLDIWDM